MNDKKLSEMLTKALSKVTSNKKAVSKIKQCSFCKTWTLATALVCPRCDWNY